MAVMDRWEYLVVSAENPGRLDDLGVSGWELVTVSQEKSDSFYLKRRLMDFREAVTLDQKRRYYREWNVTTPEAVK